MKLRSGYKLARLVAAALTVVLVCYFNAFAATSDNVALPVQYVIKMLRDDPEALQAAKQAVIEQATNEGRIVFASELSDASLFRMIADDSNIAAIATRIVKKRQNAAGNNRQNSAGENRVGIETQSLPANSQTIARTQSGLEARRPALIDSIESTPSVDISDESELNDVQPLETTSPSSRPVVPKPQPAPPIFTSVKHPYARVAALDDLYKQVSPQATALERFGAAIFQNGTGNSDNLPMDMPVGPDYVVGPGDALKLDIWGGVSQRLERIVDREGRVAIPEVGPVLVAGRSLADVQQDIRAALKTQFRDAQAEVSLVRLRSVRVYVVGDVTRPGAYDISALSTPLNALFVAGGPSQQGSMRLLRHYRGKELIQTVDLYDLLLNGVRNGLQRIESGDTVLVPPVGREITIEGMVRRPAVYELGSETDLARVLELAGGVLPVGTTRHIDIERVDAHEKRLMLSFDLPEGADIQASLHTFSIQDGDRIRIAPITSFSQTSVYLDGHVFNPGKRAWHDGMTVKDVIRSYSDLLPEPYGAHAEILRLQPPDFRPQVLAFDLRDVLKGVSAPLLQPFDTVRVYSRFDFEDAPEIVVTGEVRSPGPHATNGETRLADAVYLAGGITPDALTDNVHIYRNLDDSKVRVISANLSLALNGDPVENVILVPRDQVVVHRNLHKVDPPVVFVGGRVAVPGRYPLGEGMLASDLVRMAGGLRRGAYTSTADLTRMTENQDGNGVSSEIREIKIGRALAGQRSEDVELRDGDVLSIRQISGWDDIGASVTVRGEVAHAGTYGITPGERLSSVVKRAGGFNKAAYASGVVLTRLEVKQLAEKTKTDLIQRIEQAQIEQVHAAIGANAQEQVALTNAMVAQQREIVANLKKQEVEGRLVLRITEDVSKWENTPNDIELRDGDVLVVPKRPTFVLVSGQVYNQAALTWIPGKKAEWYLRHAGGTTENANRNAIFVVRADGSVVGHGSLGWGEDVLSMKLQPGDGIVVPEKILSTGSRWRSLLGAAQFMSALALSATVFTRI